MSRLNIDEEAARIFTPIEFTIDSIDYTVDKIENEVLESIIGGSESPRAVREAFAAMVGAKKDIFKHTDTRKLTLAMRYITRVTKEQLDTLDSKNGQGEGAARNQPSAPRSPEDSAKTSS